MHTRAPEGRSVRPPPRGTNGVTHLPAGSSEGGILLSRTVTRCQSAGDLRCPCRRDEEPARRASQRSERRLSGPTGSRDTIRCGLVAVWDDSRGEYRPYVTKANPEVLSAEEVARIYAIRWEIELVFNGLKSHYALDDFRTTNV
jgi:IS4 transposase